MTTGEDTCNNEDGRPKIPTTEHIMNLNLSPTNQSQDSHIYDVRLETDIISVITATLRLLRITTRSREFDVQLQDSNGALLFAATRFDCLRCFQGLLIVCRRPSIRWYLFRLCPISTKRPSSDLLLKATD